MNPPKRRESKQELPFRRVLSRLMDKSSLSASQVAELAGTSKSVVHSWLGGASPQDLYAVASLARSFRVPFFELLFGTAELSDKEAGTAKNENQYPGGLEKMLFSGICRVSITQIHPECRSPEYAQDSE